MQTAHIYAMRCCRMLRRKASFYECVDRTAVHRKNNNSVYSVRGRSNESFSIRRRGARILAKAPVMGSVTLLSYSMQVSETKVGKFAVK